MVIRISKKRVERYKDNTLGTIFTVEKWGNPYITLTDGKRSFEVPYTKLHSDFTKMEN